MSRWLLNRLLPVACVLAFVTTPALTTGAQSPASAIPDIVNLNSLVMTLEHNGCLGSCPIYTIEIRGDGNVTYEGKRYVAVTGVHRERLPVNRVSDLFQQARRADLTARVIGGYDGPAMRVTLTFDTYTTSVSGNSGVTLGYLVRLIETELAQAVRPEKWVKGTAETVPSLKAENWDFRSTDGANLSIVPGVARYSDVSVLRAVLSEGPPLTGSYEIADKSCRAVRNTIEKAFFDERYQGNAAQNARDKMLALFNSLAQRQLRGQDRDRDCDSLGEAASWGLPDMVEFLLAHGADPKFANSSALRQIGRWSSWPMIGQDYVAVARLLIAAGADVNARDERSGRHSLFGLRSADVARVLIMAGADANLATPFGFTPLMEASDIDVVRVLLEAGANVNARASDGRTALAQEQSTPEKARLLIAAGADVNAVESRGYTAIALTRSLELTRILLDAGADPRVPGRTLHPGLESSCTPEQRRQAAGSRGDRGMIEQNERCGLLMDWIAQRMPWAVPF